MGRERKFVFATMAVASIFGAFECGGARGLAISQDGSLLIADFRRHLVYAVDPSTAGAIDANSHVRMALGTGAGRYVAMSPSELRKLVMSARQEAHDDWMRIIDGRMNDAESKRIHHELQELSPELVQRIRHLIGAAVDTAIHHVLWEFEQAEHIGIYVQREGALTNVNELSDGLTGDSPRGRVGAERNCKVTSSTSSA